jgi:ubiquinone/menaquinone biosynthesis C-methylase UbiE
VPRLYNELSSWWPLLSAPEDYAEEAEAYRKILVAACKQPPRTVLELGSGGGNNASHMKAYFQMTLVDISEGMLAVSRKQNPELEHHNGDMRTVRLGRQFDAVFVHDAISYMTTLEDVRATVETAYTHCRPGGAAIFCPDFVRETFQPETDHGGHDGADGRALRYLEWTYDPDPQDTTYTTDFAYLLRMPDGTVTIEHDRHIDGLFGQDEWLQVIRDVGFVPRVESFKHSEVDRPIEVFVGTRSA